MGCRGGLNRAFIARAPFSLAQKPLLSLAKWEEDLEQLTFIESEKQSHAYSKKYFLHKQIYTDTCTLIHTFLLGLTTYLIYPTSICAYLHTHTYT